MHTDHAYQKAKELFKNLSEPAQSMDTNRQEQGANLSQNKPDIH